jgi:hypothetical protein
VKRRYVPEAEDFVNPDTDRKPTRLGPFPIRAWVDHDRSDGRWSLSIEDGVELGEFTRHASPVEAVRAALDDERVMQVFVWADDQKDFRPLSRTEASRFAGGTQP